MLAYRLLKLAIWKLTMEPMFIKRNHVTCLYDATKHDLNGEDEFRHRHAYWNSFHFLPDFLVIRLVFAHTSFLPS